MGIATLVLMFVLLARIFRSVLICLIPLVVIGTLIVPVATGLIAWANDLFGLKADSSIAAILVVVLFGVGTDHILFFLFRHREQLRAGAEVKSSVASAVERAGEAIASAGGAVIVAFLALLLSSLSIFRAIGPALAIAVAVSRSTNGRAAAFSITLDQDPASDASIANVKGPIRDAAHAAAPPGSTAYVGGTTSVFADMQKVARLLGGFPSGRARDHGDPGAVAAQPGRPFYLMASVGLGFGATLGATVLVIEHLEGDPGLTFMLPIYIYLFVVALGTDDNILMIARLREEARQGRDARSAAAEAVRHAGPTIAAAGAILAGTFASLMLGGNSLIVSMGFALSFGSSWRPS